MPLTITRARREIFTFLPGPVHAREPGEAKPGRQFAANPPDRYGSHMRRLEAFLRFGYEFVVGDDWRIAVGVVIALGITAIVAGQVVAWWILPVAVAVLLAYSVWRAARTKAGG